MSIGTQGESPHFSGHRVKAHHEPGGVSWDQAKIFNGVYAGSGGDAPRFLCDDKSDRRRNGDWSDSTWALATRVAPGVSREGTGFFSRSGSVLRERVAMKYRLITRCKKPVNEYDLHLDCLSIFPTL